MESKTCQKHPRTVEGYEGTLESLALKISDLHYESLTEFLTHLSKKVKADSQKDKMAGKERLGYNLDYLSTNILWAASCSKEAAEICKPYME